MCYVRSLALCMSHCLRSALVAGNNLVISSSSHIFIMSLKVTYLLTLWSRVLLEKITGCQLVKKFPAFYGTRRFITAFTSARHLSLS